MSLETLLEAAEFLEWKKSGQSGKKTTSRGEQEKLIFLFITFLHLQPLKK